MDPGGEKIGARSFKHSGDGLADLCKWLLDKADPASVAIAIEVPHGSVVETLLERGFAVFSINPKQLDRLRDRFSMAGAKDDRLDALVLADSLRRLARGELEFGWHNEITLATGWRYQPPLPPCATLRSVDRFP